MTRFAAASLLLSCVCLSLVASSLGSELKLVILLHRHGDRGPIYPMPTVDPVQFAQDFPLGPGELTGIGMSQLYQLGTALRSKYVGPTATYPNFLSPHWNHSEYTVRCTDFHRTLQSAESLLYAMFPPGTGPNNTNTNQPAIPDAFQPVPISTVPQPTDYLLIGHDFASANCPTYQKFVEDLEKSPQYVQKAQQYKPLFDALSNITGFENTMTTASVSFDTFTCYKAHNLLQLRFPAVTQDMYDQLVELARFELSQLATNESINCLSSGPLVQDILSHIQQTVSVSGPRFGSRAQQPPRHITPLTTLTQADAKALITNNKAPGKDVSADPPLKFVHYSAHDSTVWPLLAAVLGEYIFGQPPYAAHVVIELHQRNPGDYFVRFFYNDTQVLLPYCKGQMDCALSDFQAYLSPCGKPSMTDDPLCGIPATPSVTQLLQQIAALQAQVSDLENSQESSDSKVKRLTIVAGCLAGAAVILGGLLFFCLRYREIKRRNDNLESYSSLGTGADV